LDRINILGSGGKTKTMKMSRALILTVVAVIGLAVMGSGLFAADVPDVIQMKDPIYSAHTRGIVSFTHTKHYADYGISCGECHHDDKGQPLADLKTGDTTHRCSECHSKPGDVPRTALKDLAEDAKTKLTLEYHAGAMHLNCIGCHKDWNKEHGKRGPEGAPISCNDCHPKE